VKTALGLQADDAIVGFVYLGSETGAHVPAPPSEWRDLVQELPAEN
jgi:hypothetical protein